ncbi:MAG: Gfo/Idh/MocA family oxidoreductase [Bacteroidetes bacterium]|jgi:predicted dehydrogenase|nr:Gfo/Idh/MocA family oxidoreductase [Bacteroidota bacterium]
MQQAYYKPATPYHIFSIGAGGIVKDAHLPAYQLAGYAVKGIYDIDNRKAQALAKSFDIQDVYESLDAIIATANKNTIFDIALPASAIIEVLQKIPTGAAVLLQKPMGSTLAEAKEIVALVESKKFIAAVNFQLRYAPCIIAAKNIMDTQNFGTITDIEVAVNVHTPWSLWTFLQSAPRLEILYHSIHYIDLIRNVLGNPLSVYAKTIKHPAQPALASVKSNIIMDYGNAVGVSIKTNHCHDYGNTHQDAFIKIEGTNGAIKINLGLLKNYPVGEADRFEYIIKELGTQASWKQMDIEGSWFPHAFIGSMAEIMKTLDGVIITPDNNVQDVLATMACVEAAYQSSAQGGVSIQDLL